MTEAEGSTLTEDAAVQALKMEEGASSRGMRLGKAESGQTESVRAPTGAAQLCRHLDSSPLKPLWTAVALSR